jgi:hypothetical protein
MDNQKNETRQGFAIGTRFVCTLIGCLCFTAFTLPVTYADTLQQAYLKASNTTAGDFFGWAVAISGNTAVVSSREAGNDPTRINSYQANNSGNKTGAAYVFTRSGDSWSLQATLKASNAEPGDTFGFDVAISGDTLVVGAEKEDSSATGVNGDQNDNSATDSGAAYVFVRNGTTWSQQAYIKASNTGENDHFARSVAIDGDTLVVAASGEQSNATGINGDQTDNSLNKAGAVYVFTRSGTQWSQQAYLKASNPDAQDKFGFVLGISGDTLVVTAEQESSNATGINGDQNNNLAPFSGAAYVFTRAGTTWSQQAYIKASNTDSADEFGRTGASISGNTLVVGAPHEDSKATGIDGDQDDNSAPSSGAVYVYTRSGTEWSQQAYLKASNTDDEDLFGYSVALSGDSLVVGAWRAVSGAGAAYLFTRNGTMWSQQDYLKASNTEADDNFGNAVAISGHTVVVAAIVEDSSATGVNGDQSNNSAENSGAAYVFDTTQAFSINAGLNGNWWNGLDRNGEGVQVEVSDGGDGSLILVATVYSYDDMGNQIFLIAVGTVNGDTAEVEVFITEGGQWGDAYDPALVNELQWGTGTFTASSCDAMHMALMPNAEFQGMGFTDLMYDLVRLTTPAVPCPIDNPN